MTEFRKVEDRPSRLDGLIFVANRQLRNAFLLSVSQMRDQLTAGRVIRLIEQGRMADALQLAQESWGTFTSQWIRVYVTSAEGAASFIDSHLAAVVTFDQTNVVAVDQMRQNRLRLVRELTTSQRLAVQAAIADGIERGINPNEMAREIRGSIGLTQRQQQAVNNYRRLLQIGSLEALQRELRDRRFDRTVRRAFAQGEPLEARQVERMVERYRERFLAFRATTIARTESLGAVHEGNERMYDQAIEDGTLDAGTLTRVWNTAKDERVRGSHRAMHRQTRPVGVPFTSGGGFNLRFPGDPQAPPEERIKCRCAVGHRFTAVARLELAS